MTRYKILIQWPWGEQEQFEAWCLESFLKTINDYVTPTGSKLKVLEITGKTV